MSEAPILILGSKNYSSWSLRPWLFLRKAGFDFRERVIHFDAPDYRSEIAKASPSRRVPVLLVDADLTVWDSLAISEYVADRTRYGLPQEPRARAVARAVSAEMHCGFQALRSECPMNVRARDRQVPESAELVADVSRIDAIWSGCRAKFGAAGAWLFGEFSIADAMFAPVAFRFRTYGAKLMPASSAYLAHVLADPLMRAWSEAAGAEGHPLPETDRLGTANS